MQLAEIDQKLSLMEKNFLELLSHGCEGLEGHKPKKVRNFLYTVIFLSMSEAYFQRLKL